LQAKGLQTCVHSNGVSGLLRRSKGLLIASGRSLAFLVPCRLPFCTCICKSP